MAERRGWVKNQKISGQNHQIGFSNTGKPFPIVNDSIAFRNLGPKETKKDIKRKQFTKCWVPNNPGNGKVVITEGLELANKQFQNGEFEEAQKTLNKHIFNTQVKPSIDLINAGIDHDLVIFTAEDIW